MRKPQLQIAHPLPRPLSARHLLRRIMARLVVYPNMRIRPRSAKPVYTDPRQDLVVRSRMLVRPIVQLLIDPSEEGDGRGGEGVRERLRLCSLQLPVCLGFGGEPVAAFQSFLFGFRVRRHCVLEG